MDGWMKHGLVYMDMEQNWDLMTVSNFRVRIYQKALPGIRSRPSMKLDTEQNMSILVISGKQGPPAETPYMCKGFPQIPPCCNDQ